MMKECSMDEDLLHINKNLRFKRGGDYIDGNDG